MLTVLSAGMTAEEIILNGISKATDPGSGGRHMSNHFAKPEWHIENISSATGTHDLDVYKRQVFLPDMIFMGLIFPIIKEK